jgi:hypothetical protein
MYIYKYTTIINEEGQQETILVETVEVPDIPSPPLTASEKLELRKKQIDQMIIYLEGSSGLTPTNYQNLLNSIRTLIDDWIYGLPTLRDWFANTGNYATTSGFNSKAYYSNARRDVVLSILEVL